MQIHDTECFHAVDLCTNMIKSVLLQRVSFFFFTQPCMDIKVENEQNNILMQWWLLITVQLNLFNSNTTIPALSINDSQRALIVAKESS